MLVKIEHFSKNVKDKQEELKSYVIDYADYCGTVLEQIGVFRYRKICECILGKSNASQLKRMVLGQPNKKVFFCNSKTFDIPNKIYLDVISHPELFATVLFRCYR